MSDDVTFWDEIEGYCGALSCPPGGVVPLHVSTRASMFDVTVERWGAEREVVWEHRGAIGKFTSAPSGADAVGCHWPVSLEIPVSPEWTSGFYLVTMTAHGVEDGRDTAHACFVVRRNPGPRPNPAPNRMLVILATNTWNAYNIWGGRSLYTGGSQVSFERPFSRGTLSRPEVERDDRKARPVRFGEEADVDGEIFQAYRFANGYPSAIGSTGWFTHERRFVEWAERAGHAMDYAISADLEAAGTLEGYELVVSVGHDEYWTGAARDAIDNHIAGGGNFVSMSGNTMFWQVRLIERAGTGETREGHMVCHKYGAVTGDPVMAAGEAASAEMSGLWCDPIVGRPEWTTLGAGSVFGLYHRFGRATARGVGGFSVYRPDHWMLAGTDLGYGDVLGADHGVVGYETVGCPLTFDEFQLPVLRRDARFEDFPDELEIVGFALSSNLGVGEYPSSIAALNDQGDLEFLAERFYGDTGADNLARVRHGNAVMLTCRPFGPTGGEVVTIGTTDWVFGLADDPRVGRVTSNVLDRFLTVG